MWKGWGSYSEAVFDVELDLLARQGSDSMLEGTMSVTVAPWNV